MIADQERQLIPLAQVTAACLKCGWSGPADQLHRTPLRRIILGDNGEPPVYKDTVMVFCPKCPAGIDEIKLSLPEDTPKGQYRINMMEGPEDGR